jgi:type IV secretion system protein VirB10
LRRTTSVQSRISNGLAAGLMIVLGVGFLVWYYSSSIARTARARDAVQTAAAHAASSEMPLPALGPMEAPRRIPTAWVASDEGPAMPDPDALSLAPAPRSRDAGERSDPRTSAGDGLSARMPGEAALERRLSSAVFARSGSSGNAGSDASAADQAATAGRSSAALPTPAPGHPPGARGSAAGADDWSPGPRLTSAIQAQMLPTQRLLLPKGAFIDCTLETAIDSSLAGMTTCITAIDTFGVDGKVVLLERGTKLVGETRGQVQQGTSRIFVLWTEARTPAGVVVALDSPGTDPLGRAGLPGQVNRHFWDRFGAAILISMIDGAVQAAVQSSGKAAGAIIYNPSSSRDIATEVLKGTIDIPPTVVKRHGERIQILVARDVDFSSVYALRPVRPRPP